MSGCRKKTSTVKYINTDESGGHWSIRWSARSLFVREFSVRPSISQSPCTPVRSINQLINHDWEASHWVNQTKRYYGSGSVEPVQSVTHLSQWSRLPHFVSPSSVSVIGSVNQSVSQSANRSVSRSVNRSVSKPISHSVSHQSVPHLFNQPAFQPVRQVAR